MAFITGSHAYGEPGPGSDIDLVIRMSEVDYEKLRVFADSSIYEDEAYSKNTQSRCLRFGRINMLVCLTQEAYDIWLKGTQQLKAKSTKAGLPIPRRVACEVFAKLRQQAAEKEVRNSE